MEPEFRDRLLGPAVALAETHPVGTFRRKLRSLVETVRAVTLGERHERALAQRRVVLEPAEDNMAWLHQYLPAVEAQAILGRLTGQAKVLAAQPDETRTLDQLRADVLCDTLIDGVADSLPPEARGIRATVAVTVPVLALLDSDREDGGIATVEGVGPIMIGRARELCGGAKGWMRVLTHPETGIVVSVGRDRYRPPPELRAAGAGGGRRPAWHRDATSPPPDVRSTTMSAWERGGTHLARQPLSRSAKGTTS